MSDVAARLKTEIAGVEQAMAEQKRVIRRATHDVKALEAAEAQLRELHTRLSLLRSNLGNCQPAGGDEAVIP